MATPKRNDLSLKKKYEVIRTAEKEPKLGVRKLAERFQCGKTQVSTILKNKEAVRKLYESNASDSLSESDDESTNLPLPRFQRLPEAIACLEDIRYFLEYEGYTSESTEAMSLMSSLTMLHSLNLSKATRQSSLLEFFTS